MRLPRNLALALGSLALVAAGLPAGVVPAVADDTTYTYVEIQVGAGRPSSAATAINGSGLITGGWSLGLPWISDNGGPIQLLGTTGGSAWGLNEAGDVVGWAYTQDSSEPGHAFLYHDGVMTDLGTGYPRHGASFAQSVNSSLVAVGQRFAAGTYTPLATLWQDGQLQDLGTLGGTTGAAYSINDSGQVVGEAQTSFAWHHAFLWQDGVMQDLGTLGDPKSASQARAINQAGDIVGWAQSSSSSPSHAVLWQNGTPTDLGTLPDRPGSYAYGLNNVGQVVGLSRRTDNHAFIWQDGQMKDLNNLVDPPLPPGVVLAVAYGINDSGVIVGQTCNFSEECPGAVSPRAYMLIPNSQGGRLHRAH